MLAWSNLEDLNSSTLSHSQVAHLEAPITHDLVLKTLKSLKRNKAPGPNGLTVDFFLATWDVVGNDFCNATSHFFSTSIIHSGINSTSIALIPKFRSPTQMRDFRIISLCPVAYKGIAKLIANRLKLVLPSIINASQSAFIKGRSITNNFLLAQELFRDYNRDSGVVKCTLKIELHKAFDSIGLDFIMAALTRLRFLDRFKKLDLRLHFHSLLLYQSKWCS